MLGAIIGDIVGSRFEFNSTSDFDFELFTSACDYTDDSICTFAVADAILSGKLYEETMLEWCLRYPRPKWCIDSDSEITQKSLAWKNPMAIVASGK